MDSCASPLQTSSYLNYIRVNSNERLREMGQSGRNVDNVESVDALRANNLSAISRC